MVTLVILLGVILVFLAVSAVLRGRREAEAARRSEELARQAEQGGGPPDLGGSGGFGLFPFGGLFGQLMSGPGMWSLELLAEDHRLILFDYPGLGESGPWQGRSFSDLATATVELLDHLEIERAAILGWSMGGFVAQRLAIEHPERVSALILAGTNPGSPQAVLGTPQAQVIDSDPNPSDAQILTLLYPPAEQTEGRHFLRRLEVASEQGEIPDDFQVPAKTTDRQVAAEDPWLRSSENLRELRTIDAPTLSATGRTDPVTPPENMRLIADRIPNAELSILPGSHAFLFQSCEPFAAEVAELTDAAD